MRLSSAVAALLVLPAVLVPAVLVPAGSVAAAPVDPPGTVVVGTGQGAVPDRTLVEAALPEGVLVSDSRGLVIEGPDPAGDTVIASNAQFYSAAGSFVLYVQYGDEFGFRWYDAATGARGEVPDTWERYSVAPTGGLILTALTAASTRLSLQDAITGAITVLADIPRSLSALFEVTTGGPDGVVIGAGTVDGPAYVAYAPYDGSGARVYDTGALSTDRPQVSCGAPNTSVFACFVDDEVVTGALDAPDGTPLAPLATGQGGYDPKVTSTSVAWVDFDDEVLTSVPLAGGAVEQGTEDVNPFGGLVGDGSRVYYLRGAGTDAPEIVATPDASTAPTVVAPVRRAPYRSAATVIDTGGRVAYTDNSRTDSHYVTRPLVLTGKGVLVGPATPVTPPVGFAAIGLSGARTGLDLGSAEHSGYTVSSPVLATVTDDDATSGQLSGHRLKTTGTARTNELVDLVTGARTRTATFGAGIEAPGSLFGDYYTFAAADESVWRRNLATGVQTQVQLPPRPNGQVLDVDAWGDWVAVERGSYFQRAVTIVDLVAGRQRLARVDRVPVTSVGPAGYVVGGTTLTSWDGAHTVTVPGTSLTSTGSIMAWDDADGQSKAAPLPWGPVANRPRSLGDPLAPTVARGDTWTFDLPTSATLATCTVEIRRGSTLVRTLPCDPAYTAGGDAIARWDTRTAGGAPAPSGVYTWTVVAGNAAGSLQRPDGSAGAVTGTFRIAGAPGRPDGSTGAVTAPEEVTS